MAVLVTGTRFDQVEEFERTLAVAELLLTHIAAQETVFVGDARGVDAVATKVLFPRNLLVIYEAQWKQHGGCFCGRPQPGNDLPLRRLPQRTEEMIDDEPERVLAIWDGSSPGTQTRDQPRGEARIPVERYRLPAQSTSVLSYARGSTWAYLRPRKRGFVRSS